MAVLHDVVEDSAEWTLDRLREEGFGDAVISGVEAVTKRPEEHGSDAGYLAFCARAARHPLGRQVKRADLVDNLDLTRLGAEPSADDHRRLERYRAALRLLDG